VVHRKCVVRAVEHDPTGREKYSTLFGRGGLVKGPYPYSGSSAARLARMCLPAARAVFSQPQRHAWI
jgi:hypothetical protein